MNGNEKDVAEWMRFAEMDQTVAKHLNTAIIPTPFEVICFHCQQAAEKALKAVIVSYNEIPEKTHDMDKLIKNIKAKYDVPATIVLKARSLTKYAATLRYPDAPEVGTFLTNKALQDMESVIEWVKEILEKKYVL